MLLDGRDDEVIAVLVQLREVLVERIGVEICIDVLVKSRQDSKRVRAFAAMSGCQTAIEEREGHYIVHITGNPCCV